MDQHYSGKKQQQQQQQQHKLKHENAKTTNLIIESDSIRDDLYLPNMDADIINKKKWKCSQCTYENWPSALKCTICLVNKSSVNHNVVNSSKSKPSNCNQINKKRTEIALKSGLNESKIKLKFETSMNNELLNSSSDIYMIGNQLKINSNLFCFIIRFSF
jgi:hypothetical protein